VLAVGLLTLDICRTFRETKLARQSRTLEEAVREYKRRHGRNPPKGFDKWYAHCTIAYSFPPDGALTLSRVSQVRVRSRE
jgi:hypothetical protein